MGFYKRRSPRWARHQARIRANGFAHPPSSSPETPMLKFYFNGAPNPNKVALFLEESGLPYELVPVDTRKGEQFKPEFLKVNPNSKVPAIDDDGTFVFDSNAILLYLAEKTGKFLPVN